MFQAIYDDFVNNFGQISFPINFGSYDEYIKHEINRQEQKIEISRKVEEPVLNRSWQR